MWRRGWLTDFTGHDDGVELGESWRGGKDEAGEDEDLSPLMCIGHDGCKGVRISELSEES